MKLPTALTGYAAAAAGVALVSFAIGGVLSAVRIANIAMLYLVVVLAVAARFGNGPAIAASIAAFLTFDWFFIEPVHTFTIADPEEWLALLLFLVVAVVTSQLAAAQRRRADEARRREREARALHQLGRLLAEHDPSTGSGQAGQALDAGLQAVAEHLRAELGLAGVAILLPTDPARGGRVTAHAIAGESPPPEEQTSAEWVLAPTPTAAGLVGNGRVEAGTEAAGPGRRRSVRIRPPLSAAARRAAARVRFEPLTAGERTVGILRLTSTGRPDWTPEEARLIDAAARQLGLAVERTRLRREALEAEVLRQTDAARQALLDSVSHDLRTPLASIKASAGSLRQKDVQWSEAERDGFASAIEQEADRLNRLVENLLDMSRIEAGALRPDLDWYPLEAVLDDVLGRLRSATARHRVVVDVPESLPPVPLDYVQIGEVLHNLIENATRYTPPGSEIRISADDEGTRVRVTVADDGPGIPPAALPHVFEKFYRVSSGDTARTPGTGLGLAVARGLVEAHGGTMEVHSPAPGRSTGTAFRFTLPLAAPGRAASVGQRALEETAT
jgi:two-component system sensor histidine kinase KdpD